jgi:RHS repeat-associated protein
MISSTNTSTDVTTTYTYDYRNRLTEVTTGGTVVEKYTYNALNQRIGVKDSGTQTWTIFDGTSPDANPYADFNGSGSLTEHYLFGPGVVNGAVMTSILARTSSGGTTAWYLTDNLGSVRDIVSTSGSELDHIVYDSFGNIVTETDAANGDRFKFAGMQYDATIGQYFDNARWYGPGSGRFLSQDPKAFAAGDVNLYRYVGNEPTDATDPAGLEATTILVGGMTFLAGVAAAPIIINVAMIGAVAGAAVFAKIQYTQYNEALVALQEAQAENARLNARLMQLQMTRMNAQLAAQATAIAAVHNTLPPPDWGAFEESVRGAASQLMALNTLLNNQLANQYFDPQNDEDPNRKKLWDILIQQTREQMAKVAEWFREQMGDRLDEGPLGPPSLN